MDGQGVQILQQVGDLLGQLAQQEQEPTIQRAITGVMKQLEPLMSIVAQDDSQDMTSGLATPNGPGGGMPPPGADPNDPTGGAGGAGPMPGGPPDMGAGPISSEGAGPIDPSTLGGAGGGPSKTFGGAKEAAMANFASKGHFSPSAGKGEELETEKTKNRKK